MGIEVVEPEELPIPAGLVQPGQGRIGHGFRLRVETIAFDPDSLPLVRAVGASEVLVVGVEPLRKTEAACDRYSGDDGVGLEPRLLQDLRDRRERLGQDLTVAGDSVL